MAQKRNTSNKRRASESSIVPILVTCIAVCAICIILIVIMSNREKPVAGDTGTDGATVGRNTGASVDTSDASKDTGSAGVTSAVGNDTVIGTAPADETIIDTDTADISDMDTSDTTDTAELPTGIRITTKSSTFDENGAHVEMIYPSVESSGNANDITIVLRNEMDERRMEALIGTAGGASNYKVEDVSVKLCTDSFVSIVVTGFSYVGDASHPDYFVYSLNYDIKAKKLLTGEDIFKNFTTVRKRFTDGGFKQVKGQDGLLNETSYEDIIMEYRAEYGIYPEAYYTKNGFGVAIKLVYALGGYALFETTQSSLSGAIYVPQS